VEVSDVVSPAVTDDSNALARLGAFTADLSWPDLPDEVRTRALLMLTDFLGVTIAGARTPELRALLDAWDPTPGAAGVLGAGRRCGPDDAAWLNGTAACALELDEGNKHAQGHPAAHVVPAVLAAVQASHVPVSGDELLAAVVAGYEVATRFGRATRRRPDLHTHGHWGAAGAGAAAARLRALPADRIAAAIDAATGLVHVTPWSVVLAGSFVRNLWAAGANVAGLIGARLSAAGLADVDGTAARTLGEVIGGLDPAELADALGERWDITGGYFKRHAACSYTHPAADLVLDLRAAHAVEPAAVRQVIVDTHRLAMPLASTDVQTRVAAMVSLPYVVAVALADGSVGPDAFGPNRRSDGRLLDLARRVEVRHDPALDARLPSERANRLTLVLSDGRTLSAEAPNPIGDADHFPFGAAEVHAKLTTLVGDATAQAVHRVVAGLPGAADARAVLDEVV
jgi:2-methylcitrate dehydratase PrpD